MDNVILEVKNLSKSFDLESSFFSKKDKKVYAVNDVSFEIKKGQTYSLVGESGCGKTTTARLLIKMYNCDSGSIKFFGSGTDRITNTRDLVDCVDGNRDSVNSLDIRDSVSQSHILDLTPIDVTKLKGTKLNQYREKVKYIFQDPAKSLNARMTVLSIITDGLKHSSKKYSKDALYAKAKKVIEEVGLTEEDLQKHPTEFSGGQRQRISIARGLVLEPELLICDEVVSALDVSIQAQVLKLLVSLKEKRNLSYLFITHDLKVACYFSDKIGVMYKGVLLEEGNAKDFYKTACHPYSKLLFSSASLTKQNSNLEVTTLLKKEDGCPFAHRCKESSEKCFKELPPFKQIDSEHKVRCFNV